MSNNPMADVQPSLAPRTVVTRAQDSIVNTITTPIRAVLLILLVTVITHLPTGFGSFIADDFMQWAMLKGSPTLHAMGFDKAAPAKPLAQGLLDGFHFFSFNSTTLERYRHYGNMPWWSGDDISMVPFRPVAALTHWIDYTLFQDRLWLHQLHSLAYFLLLAVLLYSLYFRIASVTDTDSRLTPKAMLIVVALATLMTLVDFSMTRSFLWVVARNSYMACAVGIASLLCFIRWREEQRILWLFCSLMLFVLALLTAEAALAVAAYMGAYVLCIEKKSLLRKFLILLPVIAVILVWRMGYSQGGFGALNIAQYIDPGRSPAQFAVNFFTVFPLIALNQITGLDSLIIFFHPDHRWKLVVFAWLITMAGVVAIRGLLSTSKVNRFWFVGSVVSAIPGTALISAESRTMTFVAIGFFYLLAKLLVSINARRGKWFKRWVLSIVVTWHLLIPLLAGIALTSGLFGFSQLSHQQDSVAGAIENGKTGLVIINPDSGGMMYYLPFEWAFRQYPVPGRMSILTTGMETTELTRLSEREFLITTPAGMPLTHKSPIRTLKGEQPAISSFYPALYAQSFFTTPEEVLPPGKVIRNADTLITILDTNETGPTRLRVEFTGAESPDQKVWQWYDWKALQYQRLPALAINETRIFRGPLDRAPAIPSTR